MKPLQVIYDTLAQHFGPQHWWPGETPFEVMVGAILTQNTNWQNVARAIANLKQHGMLSAQAILDLAPERLAELIRPAGYFNLKTRRLRAFVQYFVERYGGEVARMQARPLAALREELLAVPGIGPETADSILLYALGKPSFVIDAYTHRVLHRHHYAAEEASYEELQEWFHAGLPPDAAHFNEYHALFVAVGKHYCRPNNPRCAECPLNGLNWHSPS